MSQPSPAESKVGKDGSTHRFFLFVAGEEPNSMEALQNFQDMCNAEVPGRYTLQVVDAFEEHETALAYGILVMPCLVKLAPAPRVTITGTLKDTEKVKSALDMNEGVAATFRDEGTEQERLAEAKTALEALRRGEVDAIVGEQHVLLVRLQETEVALREQEALLRLALRQAPIVLWQQDEELRYRWIYNSQLGYQDDAVVGKRDVELLERLEEAERLEALKQTVIETGVGRREEVAISRNGQLHYYDLIIEPLFAPSGRITGVTCASVDVTSSHNAEAERQRMLAELAELNETLEEQVEERTEQVRALSRALTEAEQKERQRIAQMLHDDIQQMLTALRMQVDLLKGAPAEEVQRELTDLSDFVGTITEATRSLSAELSAPVLHREELAEILDWLAGVMEEQYQVQVKVETEPPCSVADRSRREQIYNAVRELLFNVVKHAGVQEARVEARVVGDRVVVSVVDDGDGFDVETVLQAAFAGESVGLVSVRDRIRLFGGEFEVISAPGEGTRATIVMPKGPR